MNEGHYMVFGKKGNGYYIVYYAGSTYIGIYGSMRYTIPYTLCD